MAGVNWVREEKIGMEDCRMDFEDRVRASELDPVRWAASGRPGLHPRFREPVLVGDSLDRRESLWGLIVARQSQIRDIMLDENKEA